MTMPVMEADLDAARLRQWATAIDDGPFASLCWGERIAFDNTSKRSGYLLRNESSCSSRNRSLRPSRLAIGA